MSDFGIIGLPTGMKEAGKRVDFRVNDFPFLIETKGYRVAWSRAMPCPCEPISDQTKQPDPNCSECKGIGWIYLGLSSPQSVDVTGELDEVQKAVIARDGSAVIHAVMTRIEMKDDNADRISRWVSGSMSCTVRAENKLGYYDRIVDLDSEIVYAERFEADGTSLSSLRYLATTINALQSESTVYKEGTDFQLVAGEIQWISGKEPALNTRISAHYLCHPTWLVIDWPHAARLTSVKYKTSAPITPQGNPIQLPMQATVRYEFLL